MKGIYYLGLEEEANGDGPQISKKMSSNGSVYTVLEFVKGS